MAPFFRRQFLTAAVAGTASFASMAQAESPQAPSPARGDSEPFGYCLNTGTIRGHKLSLPQQIDVAAKAGYQAIEPWLDEIHIYSEQGGSLQELRRRIQDSGITVESSIGFASWIVDDDSERARGLEAAKRDMAAVREIGGKRIAAPPAGATDNANLDLLAAANRYAALLELGRQMEVVPQLELWGFSQSLRRIGEILFVAAECGHEDACVLTDIYHIYKGGSDFCGLQMIAPSAMHVIHINDYPADPPRNTITDAHRVYPGDGIAPLGSILRGLFHTGFRGFLSLELFNPTYYQQDPLVVATTGLEKTRAAVRKALGD